MALVGPGSVTQQDVNITPALDGVTEYEYVTIKNPLEDDFAIQVAQTRPVDLPFQIRKDGKTSTITNSEQDVRNIYGLGLKNSDHISKAHILNQSIIKAGKTINLKGDEAQVAVRQLVNEIIQREGKSRLLADPALRRSIEERIIVKRGTIQDLMDNPLRPVNTQITEALSNSNEVIDEPAFPGINQGVGETEGNSGTENPNPEVIAGETKKRPGRPKRTTGVTPTEV